MTLRAWVASSIVTTCLLILPLAFAPTLARLNWTFMTVDLMAFEGGFTTIPLIQREVVDRFGWMSSREFIDGIALGQVTPGPIVITPTFAVFFPSFLIVTSLAPHYDRIKRSRPIQVMVRGILAGVIGMLLLVGFRFAQEGLVDWKTWGLMAAAWIALWRKAELLLVVAWARSCRWCCSEASGFRKQDQ